MLTNKHYIDGVNVMLVNITESFFVKEIGSYLRSWQRQSNYQTIMTKKNTQTKTKLNLNEWQHLLFIYLIHIY